MSSSLEAFGKFAIWKNSKTVVILTSVMPNGEGTEELVRGVMAALDPDAELIGVAPGAMHVINKFDLSGATFRSIV